jgi:toxin ParE1/3/4
VIRRAVIFSPEAKTDLLHLYDWIADAASPATALAYVERIEKHLRGFDLASERGSLRDDIRPGLRMIGFERRLSIAFTVSAERVTILRIFYGGQDWESTMQGD